MKRYTNLVALLICLSSLFWCFHEYMEFHKQALINELRRVDISETRKQIAVEETAAYINEKLPEIQSRTSKEQVLAAALGAVTIEGLYCEFGVYTGGTINFIASKVKNTIHGFDSFEGLPEEWRDGFPEGAFQMNGLPTVRENVKLHKGWFNATLPDFIRQNPQPAAFIHFDADLYSSTKDVFDALALQIVDGTVMVFDEFFAYPGWQNGEYKAFVEFVEEHQVQFEYITFNRLGEQLALKITSINHSTE